MASHAYNTEQMTFSKRCRVPICPQNHLSLPLRLAPPHSRLAKPLAISLTENILLLLIDTDRGLKLLVGMYQKRIIRS